LINISLPSSDQTYYSKIGDFLVGPFAANGSVSRDVISYRSSLDSLSQGGALYHENDVENVQYRGDFQFIPAISDIAPAPIQTWPSAINFTYKSGTTTKVINCPGGLASNGLLCYYYWGGTERPYGIESADPHNFIMWNTVLETAKAISSVTRMSITRTEYRFKYVKSGYVYHDYKQKTFFFNPNLYVDSWDSLRSVSALKEIYIRAGGSVEFDFPLQSGLLMLQANSSMSLSTQSVKDQIDTQFVNTLRELNSPIVETDYGELAQEAVEKLNAISSNMIAFVKDLRRPQDLIPKLKNLQKLKTLSGNYLSATYGVLPTISDLKEIFGAFQRVKPYLDRNGFKTYNASHFDSRQDGNVSFSLEQRIKIAIEDEDSDFARLAQGVQNYGFALTTENVWDLIPYSFVIDWFVNIGDFLERIDTRMRMLHLNIRYATMSRKERKTLVVEATRVLPIAGTLEMVRYSRWTTNHCPVPPLFFRNKNTVSRHYLEASALLLQRTK
jgi:hypothetical protein